MNVYWFIGKRIAKDRSKGFTGFVILLSLLATALSVCVMVLSLSLLEGFKESVARKVYAFWGHVRVDVFADTDLPYSSHSPIDSTIQYKLVQLFKSNEAIHFFIPYVHKYGVLLSKYSLEGVLFKSYSGAQDYLAQFLLRGRWVQEDSNTEIVLSQYHSSVLSVDTGGYVVANFIQEGTRHRKRRLRVVGIYKTGVEMYDKNFTFVAFPLIQKLNHWEGKEIEGYELFLKEARKASEVSEQLFATLPDHYQSQTTMELFPSIFDWLSLLDINQYIIIIIMFVVAVMNMATCIITLVMDRRYMIAMLKALGASGGEVQRIFLYYACFIAGIGILLGNVLAFLLGYVQNTFHIFKLSASSYFVDNVHLKFVWKEVLFLDIGVWILCFLVLLVPSAMVRRQQVVKILQF